MWYTDRFCSPVIFLTSVEAVGYQCNSCSIYGDEVQNVGVRRYVNVMRTSQGERHVHKIRHGSLKFQQLLQWTRSSRLITQLQPHKFARARSCPNLANCSTTLINDKGTRFWTARHGAMTNILGISKQNDATLIVYEISTRYSKKREETRNIHYSPGIQSLAKLGILPPHAKFTWIEFG